SALNSTGAFNVNGSTIGINSEFAFSGCLVQRVLCSAIQLILWFIGFCSSADQVQRPMAQLPSQRVLISESIGYGREDTMRQSDVELNWRRQFACHDTGARVNVFLETCPTLVEQYKGIENRMGMTDGCSAKTDPREDDEVIRGICKRKRFELDMFFIRVNATIQQAEELMVGFNEQFVDEIDGEFPLEVYFSNSSLRLIKELSGDHSITSRSLDHTAAYLEELDSNIYSDEGLFKDIDSISKQRSEKDELHQHVADHKGEYVPQMDFVYSDMDIHKGVYQFVRLVSADICSSEQFDKSMKLWTSFVEPFFGMLPQPAARNVKNQHDIDISGNSSCVN
ncbi:paired amphipathic helix protein Sin3-like protein 4 isoform X1, partial [Tanacetum coccineum]